jgi:TolB protein
VCGEVLSAWRAEGLEFDGQPGSSEAENLALFGLPLTGEFETTLADGNTYTVQWFERARFERHPENQQPYNVLLGLLGAEAGPVAQEQPAASVGGGRIAFVAEQDGSEGIYAMNADGTNISQVTRDFPHYWSPSWSPDGTRIAFGAADMDGNWEIYTIQSDGSELTRLTNHPAADGFPGHVIEGGVNWSPVGNRIVFSSDREGQEDIYTINADGSDLTRLTIDPASDTGPSWSPDGMRIIFSSKRTVPEDRPAESDLYVMQADGSGITKLVDFDGGEWEAAWSPDSEYIAFSAHGRGPFSGDIAVGRLFLINTESAELNQLPEYDLVSMRSPTWSSDSQRLAFSAFPKTQCCQSSIYVMNKDGSNLQLLGTGHSPDWTR